MGQSAFCEVYRASESIPVYSLLFRSDKESNIRMGRDRYRFPRKEMCMSDGELIGKEWRSTESFIERWNEIDMMRKKRITE